MVSQIIQRIQGRTTRSKLSDGDTRRSQADRGAKRGGLLTEDSQFGARVWGPDRDQFDHIGKTIRADVKLEIAPSGQSAHAMGGQNNRALAGVLEEHGRD